MVRFALARLVRVFALSFGCYCYCQRLGKVVRCSHKIYSGSLTFKMLPSISQFIQAYRFEPACIAYSPDRA